MTDKETLKALQSPPPHSGQYEELADIYSALSHPIRLQIIDLLLKTEVLNCSEIVETLSIPKPNLSQHLQVLKKVGLVKSNKQGLFQNYRLLSKPIIKIHNHLEQLTAEKTKSQNPKPIDEDTQA